MEICTKGSGEPANIEVSGPAVDDNGLQNCQLRYKLTEKVCFAQVDARDHCTSSDTNTSVEEIKKREREYTGEQRNFFPPALSSHN